MAEVAGGTTTLRKRQRTIPSGADKPAETDENPAPMDVWSRSGSKYQLRAVFLLVLNIVLFSGVGMFAFWIRSGLVFAPAMEGYADQVGVTFNFLGQTDVSLGSMLLAPISVQDVPMQIPILGLLMAALIAIPILVAILYRFWASLPFIAIVAFFAVMPWLAITLLGSCLIASVRPFRTPFRFMSALLGLVPAVVYLILASAGTSGLVAGKIDPIDNIKFVAPWVLAVVAATMLFAIVLAIADLVKYRPGAIAPLLAVMFGLPVALFEFRVGRDELHYRLLCSLNMAYFEEVDASAELRQSARRAWDRHPLPRPSWAEVYELEEEKWQMALAADLDPVRSELARHQASLVARCDQFRRSFPESRYTLPVLAMRGRALDMRVDPAEFRRTKWIRFYDAFPSPASRMTWRVLMENAPTSLPGALARLRLAQIEAREGDIDRAMDKLRTLLATYDGLAATSGGSPSGSLAPAPGRMTLGVGEIDSLLALQQGLSVERVVFEARRLYGLCAANRDPLYEYDPLCGLSDSGSGAVWFGLLDLDPRHDRYVHNLKALRSAYPHARIADNIDMEIAKSADPLARRIELLSACADDFPDGDAAPETLYRLGRALLNNGEPARSGQVFDQLIRGFPDSMWARLRRDSAQQAGSKRQGGAKS